MNDSQHKPLTTTEDNTQTINEILEKQRLQEGNNVQTLSSPDRRSWVFTLKKVEFSKQCLHQGHCQVQPMKARPWVFILNIGGSVLAEHHQECSPPMLLPPPLAKDAAASRQTPNTQGEPMPHSPHHNQCPLCHYQPSITTIITFSTSVSFMKIYM
jgi:hypothetical protein